MASIEEQLLKAIRGFEGFTPRAQFDYKQYSNGYGTRAKFPGERIDRPTAEGRLQSEVVKAQQLVDRAFPGLPSGVRNAVTDLTYNSGDKWMRSGLGQLVRDGNYTGAMDRIQQYNKAGGKTLDGLTKRRAADADMMKGDAAQMTQRYIDQAGQGEKAGSDVQASILNYMQEGTGDKTLIADGQGDAKMQQASMAPKKYPTPHSRERFDFPQENAPTYKSPLSDDMQPRQAPQPDQAAPQYKMPLDDNAPPQVKAGEKPLTAEDVDAATGVNKSNPESRANYENELLREIERASGITRDGQLHPGDNLPMVTPQEAGGGGAGIPRGLIAAAGGGAAAMAPTQAGGPPVPPYPNEQNQSTPPWLQQALDSGVPQTLAKTATETIKTDPVAAQSADVVLKRVVANQAAQDAMMQTQNQRRVGALAQGPLGEQYNGGSTQGMNAVGADNARFGSPFGGGGYTPQNVPLNLSSYISSGNFQTDGR